MCGIAGFLDRSIAQGHARARLQGVLDSIRHRGPDGEGTYVAEGVALGMRRLSIIDLAGGDQPIWNEDQTVGVVFNGEIYNYVELRERLIGMGHRFTTHSDTETLVHAYEQYGLDMFEHLRGMFGFAIFDLKDRSLLLARDHFGQKPLYWCAADGKFAFASEIKALLPLPWVPRDLDPDAYLDYVSWLSIPAPRTHFKHIFKLRPGSFVRVPFDRPTEVEPKRYWKYQWSPTPDLRTVNDAVPVLDAALSDSLKVHLRADVPVGVLLSGGLDSRIVSAYAQDHQQGRLQTFTVGFSDEESELIPARKTAMELKTIHHEIELTHQDLLDNIDKVAWHLDEPVGDPAAFAIMKICQLARQHVKVLLGGEGADEMFAGYADRYRGILYTIHRSQLLRPIGRLIPMSRDRFPSTRWGRIARRLKMSAGAEVTGLRVEGFPGHVGHPLGLTEPQLSRLLQRQEDLAQQVYRHEPERLASLLFLDMEWQLAESLLLKVDKMSMAESLEMRCPFLDMQVASVAQRLSPELILPPTGPGKLILRECLSRKIHEDLSRPKRGFPLPMTKWLRGPLRERVESEIFSSGASNSTPLDRPTLKIAWDAFMAGSANLTPPFYAVWLYEVWRRGIDSAPTLP